MSSDEQNSRGTVNHAEGAEGHPDTLSKDISIPKNRGVGGRDSVPDAVPPWPKAGHEKILFPRHAKRHNCWIVLGRDRWGNQSMNLLSVQDNNFHQRYSLASHTSQESENIRL